VKSQEVNLGPSTTRNTGTTFEEEVDKLFDHDTDDEDEEEVDEEQE